MSSFKEKVSAKISWEDALASAEGFLDTFPSSLLECHKQLEDFYSLDLILFGASNTLLRLVPKLRNEIKSDFITALAFLRMIVDAVLTIYAFHHVDDFDALSSHLMRGGQLSEKKARTGEPMSYSFLSRRFETQFTYTHEVYKQACKAIHFSSLHILAHTNVADGKLMAHVTQQGIEPTERQRTEIIVATAALCGAYLGIIRNNEDSKKRARAAADSHKPK
jgi:hypothetical protein